jgi:hypothetical protein
VTLDDLLGRFQSVQRRGVGAVCICPAHDDKVRSLSVSPGDEGGLVLKCFAGCAAGDVVSKVGLTLKDLMPNGNGNGQEQRIIATYDYRAADGSLAYQVVRYWPKSFKQRRPDKMGGWIWNLAAVDRLLYRLPELLAADPAGPVWFVEGEKDADRLANLGLIATTTVGGASTKWDDRWSPALKGRRIIVIPDNDEPGRRHAQAIAKALDRVAAETRILGLPGVPDKGDVSDFLKKNTKDDLLALLDEPAKTLAIDSYESAFAAASEPVQWCVEPLTTNRSITMMSGLPGARKSMFSMLFGLLAVTGQRVGDLQSGGGHTVLWIDAENSASSWWRKMFAIAKVLKIDLSGLVGTRILRAGARRFFLDDPAIVQLALDTIKQAQPTIIVIDSLTAVHRLDEIKAGPMRHLFDGAINDLREGGLCSVLVLHHDRKPDREGKDDPDHSARGSSDLKGAVEIAMHWHRDATDRDLHVIKVTKNREAPIEPTLGVRFEMRDGELVSITTEPIDRGRKPQKRTSAIEVIAALDGPTFASAVAACEAAGISRRTAIRAWKEVSE